MKTFRNFITLLLLTSLPVMVNGQDKQKNTETVVYTTSIDCQECVNKIMDNLPREKGIRDVRCDLSNKHVTVTYNKDKTDSEQVKRSIEKLGYTAKQNAPQTQKKD